MTEMYGGPRRGEGSGGLVAEVAPGSSAARAGLRLGDRVVAVDGEPVPDSIDWQWRAGEGGVEVVIDRRGEEAHLRLPPAGHESVGVAFAQPVFDRVHTCGNDCAFCFMTQLPRGLRPSLYLRDDDFRLSFLHGNFITLTNLSDDDQARILEQRLTPLYFSLQAVSPDVRARLLRPRADRALELADALMDGGVDLHAQVVLVPGVNDGAELERTLAWCAEREAVLSVGLVPVGYTSHQDRVKVSYESPEAAEEVLGVVERWQRRLLLERGTRLVWAADEFYLNARRDLPSCEEYEGFDQYENGIGMTRAFIDEVRSALAEEASLAEPRPEKPLATLVTGELFAPVLKGLAADLARARLPVRVLAVRNLWLGGDVSVAGLLGGDDIVAAVTADPWSGTYLVPQVVANDEGFLLDGVAAAHLPRLTRKGVRLVRYTAEGLMEALTDLEAADR